MLDETAAHRALLERRLRTALAEQRLSIALPLLDELIAATGDDAEALATLRKQRAEVQNTRHRYLAKWAIGIVVAVLLAGVAVSENERFLASRARPQPVLGPLPDPGRPGERNAGIAPSALRMPPPERPLPDTSRPPVGAGALALTELRWCEFEQQRLEAARRYAEAARGQGQYTLPEVLDVMARVNRLVSSRTALCTNRIRSGRDVEQVRREVEENNSVLGRQGAELAEMLRPRAAPGASVPVPQAPAPGRPPDPFVVMQVQQRLTVLGYDAGPPDGVLGGRSRTALRLFKRQRGLHSEDDVLDDATMQALFR